MKSTDITTTPNLDALPLLQQPREPRFEAAQPPAARRQLPAPTHQPAFDSSEASQDWAYVNVLREQLAVEVEKQSAELDALAGRDLDQRRSAIVSTLLRGEQVNRAGRGEAPLTAPELQELHRDLVNQQWHSGRFQPYLDDDRMENMMIDGYDEVWVEYTGQRVRKVAPIAESDAALIQWIAMTAAQYNREFSEARPFLNLQLAGGARLAATAWVTPRPHVTIRRHRLRQVTLNDLVARGSLSVAAATFLSACVKAGVNIVVAGPQNSGKTTMLRALAAEIPFHKRIATIETERELFLHEMPDQHRSVMAFEAREGSLEWGVTQSGRAGSVDMQDVLAASQRHTIDRTIVGEVRGAEFYPMVMAMLAGAGTMSTVHARKPDATIDRLAMLAMVQNSQMTVEYARRLVLDAIDVVVFVGIEDDAPDADGTMKRHRWVREITLVDAGEGQKGQDVVAAFTGVLTADGNVLSTVGTFTPDYTDSLLRYGFDASAYPKGMQEVLLQ